VWSLPATLKIGDDLTGGGLIDFRNRFSRNLYRTKRLSSTLTAVTRLNGDQYVAQLYAGPSVKRCIRPESRARFERGLVLVFFVSES